MNILAISGDNSIGGLCHRFMRAGHSVKIHITDPEYAASFEGILDTVADWQSELAWVGKDGLILFDTTDFGKTQNELRAQGYSVVGGSEEGDLCENDRDYGQKILQECGLIIADTVHFETAADAIEHITKNPGEWVIKKDGDASMIFNYVGEMADGSDCIDVLKTYAANGTLDSVDAIILQKRARGVEIGIARYFNGTEWVGPIEFNVEHKDLCDGNLGPKTWEMGTLMWFSDDEQNKLYTATLAKLKNYLTRINFRGDIDINCIVNAEAALPLELTMRFGFPALQLQSVLCESPFEEFLKAIGDGVRYPVSFKKGYGVVILVATPPFPYTATNAADSLKGAKIRFTETLTNEELSRVHFEDVALDTEENYYLSSDNGFALHVSGYGDTVEMARHSALALIKKISIPKMFYRTDIGLKFAQESERLLKDWGWL